MEEDKPTGESNWCNVFADMRIFMRVLGDEIPNIAHAHGTLSQQTLRYITLCNEEVAELNAAKDLPTHDLGAVLHKYAELGDAAIDLIVVAAGVLHSLGLPAAEMWHEVHRANMRKRGPHGVVERRLFDGKILKPEGWVPPNHQPIIASAIAHGNNRSL